MQEHLTSMRHTPFRGIAAFALFALPAFCAKGPVTWITVRAVTHSARQKQFSTTYSAPPSATTICDPTGANCQTTSTPAKNYEATVRTLDVTDIVESGGYRYTIACKASWSGSNCVPMVDGSEFPAEVEGDTMWVLAIKGAPLGKQIRIKYHILAVQPTAIVAHATLTNADVVALKNAGFSDQFIIQKIFMTPVDFALNTGDLIELKHAGLSDAVTAAMLDASRRR